MLEIRKDIYDKIIKDAIQTFPNECCGILAGKDNSATNIYPANNVSLSPETEYLMDSRMQFKIFKTLDKIYIDMVAIYHSHPNSDCYPSKKDIELATFQNPIYIIISLADFESPEVKAFKIQDNKIIEEEIKIT